MKGKEREGKGWDGGKTYGHEWVFHSRLVSAPNFPLFGSLVAILRPAHLAPPYLYFCLRQSRAEPPIAEPRVNACQSTFLDLKLDKYIPEGAWRKQELKLYIPLLVASISVCFLEVPKRPSVTPWRGSENLLTRTDEGILRLPRDADLKGGRGWIS